MLPAEGTSFSYSSTLAFAPVAYSGNWSTSALRWRDPFSPVPRNPVAIPVPLSARKGSNGPLPVADGTICRISRVRNQYAIPRIQECQRDMQDTFFGADERLDLCFRVQVYVIPRLVPVGESLTQFRYATYG